LRPPQRNEMMTTLDSAWHGGVLLNPRTALGDLIARFMPPFGKVFANPIASPAGKKRYTLTLQPDGTAGVDTYLDEGQPATNQQNIFLSIYKASGSNCNRTLIKFDLSTIPAGAIITSATLSLWCQNQTVQAGTMYLYRILPANSGWTRAGATWNHAVENTVHWAGSAGCSTSGTDYSSTLLGSVAKVGNEPIGTLYSFTLNVAEMQLLLANNCGIIGVGNATILSYLRSCLNATAAQRPKITVIYDA